MHKLLKYKRIYNNKNNNLLYYNNLEFQIYDKNGNKIKLKM